MRKTIGSGRLILALFGVALSCLSLQSQAIPLTPGGSVSLSGTTTAARPELAGLILEDRLINFDSFGPGFLNYRGVLQDRVMRSFDLGTLIFEYRIRGDTDEPVNGAVISVSRDDFTGFLTDVDFSLDGLGTIGPNRGSRSPSGSTIDYDFTTERICSRFSCESRFVFALTDAIDFALVGSTTIRFNQGASVTIPTFAPVRAAVPEPATITLFLGVLGLLGYGRLRWKRACPASGAVSHYSPNKR